VRPADLLRGAEGRVEKLASSDNDVMPRVFEGLIRFHQHDLPGADRELQKALAADDANALALSLRALVELADGKVKPAEADARRAAAIGRQVPLAHYAAGAALAAGGDVETAKQELNRAHALAPAMAAADLKLAEIEARTAPKAAKDRLQQVLSLDPSYAEARRALFALEVE
jgi:tetratricopeptide (TPR) repeat protein